jgi:hypothetical protein
MKTLQQIRDELAANTPKVFATEYDELLDYLAQYVIDYGPEDDTHVIMSYQEYSQVVDNNPNPIPDVIKWLTVNYTEKEIRKEAKRQISDDAYNWSMIESEALRKM